VYENENSADGKTLVLVLADGLNPQARLVIV
jgi:hypothetical protein